MSDQLAVMTAACSTRSARLARSTRPGHAVRRRLRRVARTRSTSRWPRSSATTSCAATTRRVGSWPPGRTRQALGSGSRSDPSASASLAHGRYPARRRLLAGGDARRARLPRHADPVPRRDTRRKGRLAPDERRGHTRHRGGLARHRRLGGRGQLDPRRRLALFGHRGRGAGEARSRRSTIRRPISVASTTTIETANTITATAITCGSRLGNRNWENR